MSNFGREFAVARFAAVAIIELVALLICFFPLVRAADQWQKDCRKCGFIALIVALVVGTLMLSIAGLAPRSSNQTTIVHLLEAGVIAIYILNVVALSLVTARSGGPTSSLYGTLIPIQLSAMLFLQLQKDRLTGEASVDSAIYYAVIGIGGYLAAHYLKPRLSTWKILFTADPSEVDYAAKNASWAAWLTVGAMALSFATYAVPSNEHFVSQIRSWYGISAPSTTHQPLENK
ncbi:MAG: hypothetical protein WAN65_30665 [Candidatus Sulfotelmatobacter sp.]